MLPLGYPELGLASARFICFQFAIVHSSVFTRSIYYYVTANCGWFGIFGDLKLADAYVA